ncbi:MAG: hypothetical protein KGY69_11095 [Bacteroidales bacterium]|nr:hypothetical protein [Bacteroidales bacterium]
MSSVPNSLEAFSESTSPPYIKIGTVLRLYVKDITPPKPKRFIVVGFTDDKSELATVFINSNINEKVNWSIEHQNAQIKLPKDKPFLERKSYVDCSELKQWSVMYLESKVKNNPEYIIGELEKDDLDKILNNIKYSQIIKGKYLKKYGFKDK